MERAAAVAHGGWADGEGPQHVSVGRQHVRVGLRPNESNAEMMHGSAGTPYILQLPKRSAAMITCVDFIARFMQQASKHGIAREHDIHTTFLIDLCRENGALICM